MHEDKNNSATESVKDKQEESTAGMWAYDVFSGVKPPKMTKKLGEIVEHEIPLTDEEIKIFSDVREMVRSYVSNVSGLNLGEYSEKNLHMLSEEDYLKIIGVRTKGSFLAQEQQTVFNAEFSRKTPLHFASTICHELIHQYSNHQVSFAVNEKRERLGYVIWGNGINKYKMYDQEAEFSGIEEALVSETQAYLMKLLVKKGYFKQSMPELYEPQMDIDIQKFTDDRKISEGNIIYVGKKPEDSVGFAYENQRIILSLIIRDIQSRMKEPKPTNTQVFEYLFKLRTLGKTREFKKILANIYGEDGAILLLKMGPVEIDQKVFDLFAR